MINYQLQRRIVNETNITEVVSEYVTLTKKGNSMFGLCPFHNDNNPSMSVSDKVKMYNCFSCGAKGNVISFVSRIENITLDQAAIKLAKRIGIQIDERKNAQALKEERLIKVMEDANQFYKFYLKNSDEGVKAREYLNNRGITDEIIDEFEIGLSSSSKDYLYLALSKNNHSLLDAINLGLIKEDENGDYYDTFRSRIMFPIKNRYGKVVGFSGRIYTESNQAKYINSIENDIFHKSEILYNYHNAMQPIRQNDSVYLFEGFMDVIAAKKAGIHNSVATMGTALTTEHVNMLLGLTKNIVLCFDGDNAGVKAMKRSCFMLSKYNNLPNGVVLPDGLDPDEYLNKYGTEKLINYLETNKKNVYYWLYELAYKKMIPSDLVSMETFKNEVFEFLRTTNVDSIHSFFFKKLSNDLDVSVDKLMDEFNKLKPKQVYQSDNNEYPYNYNQDIATNKDVLPVPDKRTTKLKTLKVTKKIQIAYDSIIKHSIFSKDRFAKFFEQSTIDSVLRYPGKELVNQYLILVEIQNFYAKNDYLGIENLYIILENSKELLDMAIEIVQNRFINVTLQENFDECLNAIIEFYKKQDQINAYNEAILSTSSNKFYEKSDEYIKLKEESIKIVRKENNI